MIRSAHFVPAALFAILILVASTTKGENLPEVDILNADKIVHLCCYLTLSLSLSWGFMKTIGQDRRWISAGIAFVYGFMIECIQGLFIPSRHFDFLDVLANGFGCILSVILVPFFWRK